MSRSRPATARRLLEAWLLPLSLASAADATEPQSLQGTAAEEFLRTARVVDSQEIPVGVTNPLRLTLTDGERTAHAAWKTIDEYAPVKDFHDGRPKELGFRDSWKHELAAYHLDKLLGLDLVPPTVARRIDGEDGALQLWLEGAMTDTERRKQGLEAPDAAAWNRQIYTVRILRQLTHDTDYNNTGNVLIDEGFRVWAIDHSRAFKTRKRLLAEGDLERFPSGLLERLRDLDRGELDAAVGEWLTPRQCATLLARRDIIVRRADRLIAERGAAAVLLP